jgi:hypothetical protein
LLDGVEDSGIAAGVVAYAGDVLPGDQPVLAARFF